MSLIYCKGAPKLAKLLQGQQFFPVVYCLTRCRRFDFKVTYYCSNHLKLHMDTPKRHLYERL